MFGFVLRDGDQRRKYSAVYVLKIDNIIVDIVIVDPDISADGIVNISDIVFLADSYNLAVSNPDYNACCDFNHYWIVNISDFAFLGVHYTHECLQ